MMDRFAASLCAGISIFVGSAVILTWSLFTVVSTSCFLVVVTFALICSPVGLALPVLFTRSRGQPIRLEHIHLLSATALTLLFSSSCVVFDRHEYILRGMSFDPFVRTFVGALGYTFAVNLIYFFLCHLYLHLRVDLHRWKRKTERRLWPEMPTMRLVDELEEVFPADVECIICLDLLAELAIEQLRAPSAGDRQPSSIRGRGILRLPCGHPFHSCCLGEWLDRGEARCPTCRAPFPGLSKCECIVLRAPESVRSASQSDKDTTAVAAVRGAIGLDSELDSPPTPRQHEAQESPVQDCMVYVNGEEV